MNNSSSINFLAHPSHTLTGTLRVPGDKSISHRAIMLSAIAEGTSRIEGFLEGEDCLATLTAFKSMGVDIQVDNDAIVIQGRGKHGLIQPNAPLDLGNSGTAMRLMLGLLAGAGLSVSLTGDESLEGRPMQRVIHPLELMGASIFSDENRAPLTLSSGSPLRGISYEMPMASAQVKSCLLLAGLYAEGDTTVIEPAVTRDHTERMLETFGYPVIRKEQSMTVNSKGMLTAVELSIPADLSSAAFFMVAACIAKKSRLTLLDVGLNPTRTGVIHILKKMGAKLTIENERHFGSEPVADLHLEPSELQGIMIPEEWVSLAIDEFPVLLIAAACAKGKTIVKGARELRVKETDRIQAMADGLHNVGIVAEPTADGIVVTGGEIQGGEVDSYGDHRIAMAFAMASLAAKAPIHIKNGANVATSFPNFVVFANELGLNIEKYNEQ